MAGFLEKLDSLAAIETENKTVRFLERIAFVFLVLMVLSMPHSIAATQTAWLIGMLAWVIRLFIKPRPKLFRTPLDVAIWALFGWSVISSIFSYAPDISLDKLRGVSLFLIFYFTVNNLRSKRAVFFLALAFIFSCMVNVVWTPIDRAIGRGVEVQGIAPESPLAKAMIQDGDTLLKANKKKIGTPEELLAEIEQNEITPVEWYRPDYNKTVEVKRADLLNGANALERLGFANWKKSHNWRSAGFYGHFTTYAEVLQLIASLVFGMLVVFLTQKRKDKQAQKLFLILIFCLFGMSLALLLTVTRSSQLSFMISAFSIVLIGGNRKIILMMAAISLPLIIGGLIFLQTSRHTAFFDPTDNSTTWRTTVWREGFNLWTENARNFTLGVGMDSIKRYAGEWHLFDDGRLPMGHFHNTYLQLAVERGFPALLLWLWILFIYAKTLFRGITNYELRITNYEEDLPFTTYRLPLEKGILLGCLGGLIGFITSGFAHYNLGDAEVAMVFFFLMGLGIKLTNR